MNRIVYLAGISAAALAAGTASAQSNSQSVNCSGAGTTCEITQAPANGGNNATLFVQGEDNGTSPGSAGPVLVIQNGQANQAAGEIVGDENGLDLRQTGDRHRVTSVISGDDNGSYVAQAGLGTTTAGGNIATVRQVGEGNRSNVRQNVANDGTTVQSTVGTGIANTATVTQTGDDQVSDVNQRLAGAATGAVNNNSATVNQTGLGSESYINQNSRGNIAEVNLFEGGATFAAGRIVSDITQTNTFLRRGASGVVDAAPAGTAAGTNPMSNNNASVSIRGLRNATVVNQNGLDNRSEVSLLSGGTGVLAAPETRGAVRVAGDVGGPDAGWSTGLRDEGNYANVTQRGVNNVARVSAGGSAQFNGRGNDVFITQGAGAAFAARGTNHTADVYQRGVLDLVTIYQADNTLGGANNDQRQSGSTADVSQLGVLNLLSIVQFGTNTAEVTQGRDSGATDPSRNTISLNQTDTGDGAAPSTGDPFPGGPGAPGLNNSAAVAQYGFNNRMNLQQNTRGGTLDAFQARGTRDSNIFIRQDASANLGLVASVSQDSGRRMDADVNQTGAANASATVTQASTVSTVAGATTRNSVTVTQAGNWNTSNVSQSGNTHVAAISQQGVGTSAFRNSVTITQTGARQQASVLQTAGITGPGTVGATAQVGDPANAEAFPNSRAAGSTAAAEAVILQGGSNLLGTAQTPTSNQARIEQRANGQYARIFQDGSNNRGEILQDTAAVNAVAIIEQTGNSNSYSLYQNAANQYQFVRQTGTGNATVVTSAGTGGGGTTPVPAGSFGAVPGAATFTP